MAPFTAEEVFRIAARYNEYIEPLQILIYIPTLLIFVLLRRGTRQDTSRGVLLLLAAEWAMVGVLLFFNIVAKQHWVGVAAGAFFIMAGLFYAAAASLNFPPHFHWRKDNPSLLSLLMVAMAIMGYPALSWLLGRDYPQVTTYGLMPSSVAMLTLGVLISARPGPRLWLLVPPLLIAFAAPVTIWWWEIWEDFLLPPLALLALLGWARWRSKNKEAPTKDTIRFDF